MGYLLSTALFIFVIIGECAALESADTLRLKTTIETLSEPRFDGRLLGSSGGRDAREWIREQAASAGLLPAEDPEDPRQPFQVLGRRWESLEAGLYSSQKSYPLIMKSESRPASQLGAIQVWPPELAVPSCPSREILLRDFNPALGESPSELLDEAAVAGAGALILLPSPDDERDIFSRYSQRAALGERSAHHLPGDASRPMLFYGSDSLRTALSTTGDPWRLDLPDYESFSLEGANLLYRLPHARGSDPILLLIAHFDHLGRKGDIYYPGANDNASGVAVLLELARLLQERRYPFQLRFLFSDGEEEGWLGARACLQTSDRPALAINLDTVGRAGVTHYRFLGNPSAAQANLLMFWSERPSAQAELLADMAGKAGFYFRSAEGPVFERAGDHFPFAQAGVPAMFLFGGFHPDYHEPGDTPEKVLPGKLEGLTNLLRDYLDSLAEDSAFSASTTR